MPVKSLEDGPFSEEFSYQAREKTKADILKISQRYPHPGRVTERMLPISFTAGSVWGRHGRARRAARKPPV